MRRLIVEEPHSRAALWSLRTAIFALAAAAVAVGLARFAGVEAGAALTVFAAALTLAFLALLLAGSAGVVIWRTGRRGAGQAAFGCFLSLALLAYPVYLTAIALPLPMIADVTTDFASPPAFMISAKARAARAGHSPPAWNPVDQPLQQEAYPKVQPILVDLEPAQAYQLVLRVAKDLGWKIVDSNPPNLRVDGVAQIEAIARSPVFGFADDIAVRVRPLASQTRIDLRSASRVGRQDFGANARHFDRFAAAVQDALHAYSLLKRNVDYVVRNDCIELVDEFKGRIAQNRRWPAGLQSAIEAKERVGLKTQGRICGSITVQSLAGMYERVCGMTGTAATQAECAAAFVVDRIAWANGNKGGNKVLPSWISIFVNSGIPERSDQNRYGGRSGRPFFCQAVGISHSDKRLFVLQ